MLNKVTGLGWQILTQAVTLVCMSVTPNVRGLNKQTGGTGSYCGVRAPVCFVQRMPVAHCVRVVTNGLVMERSAVDKAKGFHRIQTPFTFPLEEFNCVLKYTVP